MGEATEDREKLSNPPKATKDSKQSLDLSPCFELHPTSRGQSYRGHYWATGDHVRILCQGYSCGVE